MSNAIMNWKTCSFLSALNPSNQFGLREAPGLDGGLFDSALVGVDCERELTREP
jgi:hypothetical protein